MSVTVNLAWTAHYPSAATQRSVLAASLHSAFFQNIHLVPATFINFLLSIFSCVFLSCHRTLQPLSIFHLVSRISTTASIQYFTTKSKGVCKTWIISLARFAHFRDEAGIVCCVLPLPELLQVCMFYVILPKSAHIMSALCCATGTETKWHVTVSNASCLEVQKKHSWDFGLPESHDALSFKFFFLIWKVRTWTDS